jgi:hypothetical protein
VRNPGGFLELESTTVVPLLQQWQTRKQQKFNAVKPEYLLYSDCRIYLIPDPIKLVSAAGLQPMIFSACTLNTETHAFPVGSETLMAMMYLKDEGKQSHLAPNR